jgi:hypothetical protein
VPGGPGPGGPAGGASVTVTVTVTLRAGVPLALARTFEDKIIVTLAATSGPARATGNPARPHGRRGPAAARVAP